MLYHYKKNIVKSVVHSDNLYELYRLYTLKVIIIYSHIKPHHRNVSHYIVILIYFIWLSTNHT